MIRAVCVCVCADKMRLAILAWNLHLFVQHASTRTCTIRMLNPVSLARPSRILRHGFGEMSKEALKARRC